MSFLTTNFTSQKRQTVLHVFFIKKPSLVRKIHPWKVVHTVRGVFAIGKTFNEFTGCNFSLQEIGSYQNGKTLIHNLTLCGFTSRLTFFHQKQEKHYSQSIKWKNGLSRHGSLQVQPLVAEHDSFTVSLDCTPYRRRGSEKPIEKPNRSESLQFQLCGP